MSGKECQVKPEVKKHGKSIGYDQEIIDAVCWDIRVEEMRWCLLAGRISLPFMPRLTEEFQISFVPSQTYPELFTSPHPNLIFTARVPASWNKFLFKTSYHSLKTSDQPCCSVLTSLADSFKYILSASSWPNSYLCSLFGIDLWTSSLIVLGTLFLWLCCFCLLQVIILPA